MNQLNRWNPETREYEPYGVPSEWNVSTYGSDMEAQVNCAGCGHVMAFGDTYTSRFIHARSSGFGYGVCDICHEAEVKHDLRAMERRS